MIPAPAPRWQSFISRRARELRLSRHDIAHAMHLDLERIEHGRVKLNPKALSKLARLLEVSAEVLRSELAKDARALNVFHGVSLLEYGVLRDGREPHQILAAAGIDFHLVAARGHGLTRAELLSVADELRVDRAAFEAELDERLGGF